MQASPSKPSTSVDQEFDSAGRTPTSAQTKKRSLAKPSCSMLVWRMFACSVLLGVCALAVMGGSTLVEPGLRGKPLTSSVACIFPTHQSHPEPFAVMAQINIFKKEMSLTMQVAGALYHNIPHDDDRHDDATYPHIWHISFSLLPKRPKRLPSSGHQTSPPKRPCPRHQLFAMPRILPITNRTFSLSSGTPE